jgi:hypothetical protein
VKLQFQISRDLSRLKKTQKQPHTYHHRIAVDGAGRHEFLKAMHIHFATVKRETEWLETAERERERDVFTCDCENTHM